MYCAKCDKSFSPVHSRCPECQGWLKVGVPATAATTVTSTSSGGTAKAQPAAPLKDLQGWGAASTTGHGWQNPTALPLSESGGGLGESGWSPPAAAGSNWLGGAANHQHSPLSSSELGWAGPSSTSAGPILEALTLPEDTVPVDLGTPWNEPEAASSSSGVTKVMLATLVTAVSLFVGIVLYDHFQAEHHPVVIASSTSEHSDAEVARQFLAMARQAQHNHKYAKAAESFQAASAILAARGEQAKLKEAEEGCRQANLDLAREELARAQSLLGAGDPRAQTVACEARERFTRYGAKRELIDKAAHLEKQAQSRLTSTRQAARPREVTPTATPLPCKTPRLPEDKNDPVGKKVVGHTHHAAAVPVAVPAQPPIRRPAPPPPPSVKKPDEIPLGQRNVPTGYGIQR